MNFADYDFLVVVDDWQGSAAGKARSPAFFSGRIYRPQLALADLVDCLITAKAHDWHARLRKSWFGSASFEAVLAALERTKAPLLADCPRVEFFSNIDLEESVPLARLAFPELLRVFPPSNPYAMALLHFIAMVLKEVAVQKPDGAVVAVVCDLVSWLSGQMGSLPLAERGLRKALEFPLEPISVELFFLDENKAERPPELACLMGLADSEAWAFGRMASRKLTTGESLNERLERWRDERKRPDELFALEIADWLRILKGQSTHLVRYWMWSASTYHDGRILPRRFLEPAS